MYKSKISGKVIEEQFEKEPIILTVGASDNQNLTCAWCYKSIETLIGEQKQELSTFMRIPIPKKHPKPEQFIENTITKFATSTETIVKINEGAVEVLYCFCSKQHKNEYKAYLSKKETIAKRGQTNGKENTKQSA